MDAEICKGIWSLGPITACLLPRGPRSTEISGVVRGLGLCYGGMDITGEGMGIGGVVLRSGGVTFFPMEHIDVVSESGASRTFELNALARKYLGALDVTPLHRRIRDSLSPLYMRGGKGERFFKALMRLRSLLISTRYRVYGRIEVCTIDYSFNGDVVELKVSRETGRGKLIVANELAGTLFDTLMVGDRCLKLRPWTRCPSRRPVLVSKTLGINLHFDLPDGVEVFAGREVLPPRLNWAGIDLLMDEGLLDVSYRVRISYGPSRRIPA
ncbi:MAG: hypothetical protein ACO2O1_09120 [Candidatus Caldarchaeales archaeon]|jgi:hypothetical protein